MVKIIGSNVRRTKDGRSFTTLELSGGLEFVQSQSTGKTYAVMRRCSVPSSLDEATVNQLVGTEIPGSIVKIEVDPYEYMGLDGNVMLLNHSYAYQSTPEAELISNQTPQHSF